jgi:hypothetical protein
VLLPLMLVMLLHDCKLLLQLFHLKDTGRDCRFQLGHIARYQAQGCCDLVQEALGGHVALLLVALASL